MLNIFIVITFALALITALVMSYVDVHTYVALQGTANVVMLTAGTTCIVLCLIKLFTGNNYDT